jgi:hypothetical protein
MLRSELLLSSRIVIHLLAICFLTKAHGIHQSGAQDTSLCVEKCGWNSLDPLRIWDRDTCPKHVNEDAGSQSAPSAPWTHEPYCADSPYCVFTNSMFHGNYGISIIATPETIGGSTESLGKSFRTPLTGLGAVPPYEVKDIPGKGKGVIATRMIRRGETFMIDYAALLASVEFPAKVTREQRRLLLDRAVDQLSEPEAVRSLARISTSGAPVVEDVLRTNSFTATLEGEAYMALFPEIAVSYLF